MQIDRKGSRKNHGIAKITLRNVKTAVQASEIVITSRNVADFGGDASHDYTVHISVKQFGEQASALADAVQKGTVSSAQLTDLVPYLTSLLQLSLACARWENSSE